MESPKFSWRARFRSFIYAFEGVSWFFKREHNAWIHGAATLIVLILSFFLKLSAPEFVTVLFAIALVLIAEMFNTAIEKIMDHLSPGSHPAVKTIKDVAAGAVLIAAIVAATIGSIIFIPKIL